MGKYDDCDFRGWATRKDVLCSDGRTIRQDAFKEDDGKKVPLIWGHQHDSPEAVLGHGYLEARPEGMYFYGYLNDSPMATYSREAIKHGDITSLSIWANNLIQKAGDVLHGSIKEVSLVLAGANRKAVIEYPYIAHGDDIEENMTEAYIWMGDAFSLAHSDTDKNSKKEPDKDSNEPADDEKDDDTTLDGVLEELSKDKDDAETKGEIKMAEEAKKPAEESSAGVGEILNTLNDDQKMAVAILLGAMKKQTEGASKVNKETEDNKGAIKHSEGGTTMQYNAFDTQMNNDNMTYLSHADEVSIIKDAKKLGKLSDAIEAYAQKNSLAHDDGDGDGAGDVVTLAPVSGFGSYPNGNTPAAIDSLFPEWHDVRPGAPEIVTNDQAWVKAVLNGVHRSPFSRIRTSQVDLREIEGIRAKGYVKGKEKVLSDNYNVARRTTAPQTVYVKSALNRDDIVDITDFDYVDYQYKIDRMMLEKELAQAILIGDGRQLTDANKIFEENIRPVWTDEDLFTIHKVVDFSAATNDPGFGTGYVYATAAEEAVLDAMVDYRGSGAMTMFYEQSFFNKMQLARDLNGRRLYNNKNELLATLNVGNAFAVPEFQNKTRTVTVNGTSKTYKLLAILINMTDYNLGATKGGEITSFRQFDIDFNQEKSLLETRVSGANTRIYSAIVLEEEVS